VTTIHILKVLHLTLPEQDYRVLWETQRAHTMVTWYSLALFRLDVICHNDTGKKHFHLANREKTPMAVENYYNEAAGWQSSCIMTHHACRPSPKARWLGDVLTAEFPVLVTLPSLSWSPEK